MLLNHNSVEDLSSRADDRTGELHPGSLGHAAVFSLSVLGQGGEGIKHIATHTASKSEALCLWETSSCFLLLRRFKALSSA